MRVSTHAKSRPGRIGLALAGGGFLGAAYELGALCALSESIDGLDLTRQHVYVGVSAGSFIAAGLANGVSAHRMMRMFIEGDDDDVAFEPSDLIRPASGPWRKALRQAPAGIRESLRAALDGGRFSAQAALWHALDRGLRMLPGGLIEATPAERRLAEMFSHASRTNDFRRLATKLRIVATDIDSGVSVVFGSPGHDHVPISRAAVASSAVPGLFAPVRIGGRRYVDGALNKTLHASVALEAGVGLVICVNPLVPFDGAGAAARRVSRSGVGTMLSQTIRTAIRSRMSVGLDKYRVTHPGADVVVFEPRRDDAELFFANMFSVSSRHRLCEHAYRSTRADLLARAAALDPVLRRHGLALNEAVLRERTPRLVRESPRAPAARSTRAAQAVHRLARTLDDLERSLVIAGARRSPSPA